MSRTQFHAKSGASAAVENGVAAEEIECAGVAGRVQIKTAKVANASWFWLPAGAGAAGAGGEGKTGLDWQHGILPPQWQQAWVRAAPVAGGCANSGGVPASRKLQRMASASFMK